MTLKEDNESTSQKPRKLSVPRILHFAPGFRYGGVESLLMAIYEKIEKSELQFDFMIDSVDASPTIDRIRSLGGQVFQMGRFMDSPLRWMDKMNKIIRQNRSEYIALHSHDILRSLPVLLASQKYGIKRRILHAHTDSFAGSRGAILAPLITQITRPFATEYWACSSAAAQFSFASRPARIFNNVIDTKKFQFSLEARLQRRKELGLSELDVLIGHTGRFTYLKNHKKLVKIFNEFKKQSANAHLVLIGEGPLLEEIRSLTQFLQITNRVHFLGRKELIAPYLSAMDIFLMPSIAEGFCISLVEAQANGLPCLASDVVPAEVMLTPDLHLLSLEDGTERWTENIQKLLASGRGNSASNIEKIRNAKYCNDFATSEVLKWYLTD